MRVLVSFLRLVWKDKPREWLGLHSRLWIVIALSLQLSQKHSCRKEHFWKMSDWEKGWRDRCVYCTNMTQNPWWQMSLSGNHHLIMVERFACRAGYQSNFFDTNTDTDTLISIPIPERYLFRFLFYFYSRKKKHYKFYSTYWSLFSKIIPTENLTRTKVHTITHARARAHTHTAYQAGMNVFASMSLLGGWYLGLRTLIISLIDIN